MNKHRVIIAIQDALQAELNSLVAATSAALDEATREENRAENKYDTRGLEASYLAGAQSERLLALKQLVSFYGVFKVNAYGPDDPISVGALVELEEESGDWWCFMAPRAGGKKLDVDGEAVVVLSGASPLGRALLGKREGDEVVFQTPKGKRELVIATVQ